MAYADFDTERRRITHAWGREITDPEHLAAAAEHPRRRACGRSNHRDPEPLTARRRLRSGRW